MKHAGYGRYDVEVNGQVVGRAVKRPEGWEATGKMAQVEVTVYGHDSLESACMAIGRALTATEAECGQLRAQVERLERERGLLAEVLWGIAFKLGIAAEQDLNGPQLLMLADDTVEYVQAVTAERDQLKAQVERLRAFLRDSPLSTGVCCCGDSEEHHPVDNNHQFVDAGEHAIACILEETPARIREEANPQAGSAPKEPCTCSAATDPHGMHAPWCPWMECDK